LSKLAALRSSEQPARHAPQREVDHDGVRVAEDGVVLGLRRCPTDEQRADLARCERLTECDERDLVARCVLSEGVPRQIHELIEPGLGGLPREVTCKLLAEKAVRLAVETDEVVGGTKLTESRCPGLAVREALRSLSVGEGVGRFARHHHELHVTGADPEDRAQPPMLLEQKAERIGGHRHRTAQNGRPRGARRSEWSGSGHG
jgi:hypothetical protein